MSGMKGRILRNGLRQTVMIFLLAVAAGCGDDPLNTTADCDANNTATVKFENKSTSSTTYDVIWDGSKIETLTPGQTSQEHTVNATSHTLTFEVANTNTKACSTAYPNLTECTSNTYSCSY